MSKLDPSNLDNVYSFSIAFALFFLTLRLTIYNFIVKKLAQWGGIENPKTKSKFTESIFKILFYLPAWLWSAKIGLSNEWIQHTKNCWRGYPYQLVTGELALFYEMEFGFYLFLVFGHTLLDARRKDFYQMLAHHVVTLLLISVSWYLKYHRMGSVVFFCMDLCDVFLEGAKVFNYLKWEVLSNIFFGFLLLAWILFRIILFPIIVIWPTFYEAKATHDEEGCHDYNMATWWFFNVMLWVLQLLQYYWFYLIIVVALKVLREGSLQDIREEKDEDVSTNRNEKLKSN